MTRREVERDHAAIRAYCRLVRRWQDAPRQATGGTVCVLSRRDGQEMRGVGFAPADLRGGNK